MGHFSQNAAGKVEFFGTTTATPDFLTDHGIFSARKTPNMDVLVEGTSEGSTLMYLLLATHQQLRVVGLPELDARYAQLNGASQTLKIKAMAVIAAEQPAHQLGEVLYQAHHEDEQSRSALLAAAYDAAVGAGVSHATARWFAQTFVQDTFFGCGDDQEFTDRGVFRGPTAFYSAHATVKKQLQQLQVAGVMASEELPKKAGFYLRFSRASLPASALEKLPQFFQPLLF